ncbi:CubicO group peptidase (beta-lactamase class C family) [Chryseobacterium sp. PvR013]|uniref:serine hydrolase domain-containing protein n=1 Tax=Chryseobacterium sp. PvR013 TaxID=2806595 RepID=UPI001AE215F0|nr:serine hydrolase domain-containing protein [Chryseobacterium sp. PvR013]MBP1163174.1 CubicO group peptidase (beta-lactamase class C family) [Chryseobacterium sp. PvR013]
MKPILVLLLFPILIFGQKNVSENLAKYMQAQVEINNFSGTVLVSKDGRILLKKAYGLADYEWNIKNTIDTKFQLASVTKQFTATAILLLIERGKLSLDDKLSTFLPDYPKADSVTIHMLLSHTSGLAMGFKEIALSSMDKDAAYAEIKKIPYEFSPGTKSGYSNIGYYLLAKIIEKVSGEKYAVFLRKNIFEKAGMKNTGVSNNESIVEKKAKAYYRTESRLIHNPYINWEINVGHDGVYSTVEDLALWDKALYGTEILSAQMKKLMFTPYGDENWGYGFIINPFYNHGHQLIAHDGGFFGTMTSFNRFTDDKLFVTVLSNNESFSYIISYGLSAIALGKEVELPYKHHRVEIDPNLYDQYIGKYDKIDILKIDGKLYFNNADMELIPESKTKFFRADNNDRTIEFIQDNTGLYNSIILTKGGVKEVVRRSK